MNHVAQSRASVAIMVMSCMVSRSSYAENQSAFTHEDILTVLRDQEGRIDDFLLEFDSEEAGQNESGVFVPRRRETIMLMAQGPLFRTRRQSFDPQTGEMTMDKELAGDGAVEYFCDRPALYGTVTAKLPEQCVVRQAWADHYLLSVMRCPRRKGNYGFEGNLIGALEEAPKGIKISEELVDGRKIVVLTRFSSPGVPHSEIRLDPQMNFAVLSKVGIGPKEGAFKFTNSDFVEVIDGLWLPRKVEYFRGAKAASQARRETLQVKTLAFNKGFDKGDFAVQFPYGTRVRDVDAKISVTPSPKEVNEIYLDHLLRTAREEELIDVCDVGEMPREYASNEANGVPDAQPVRAAPAHAKEGAPAVMGRGHLSWKMAVTFLMLGSAGIVYLLSRSAGHKAKT